MNETSKARKKIYDVIFGYESKAGRWFDIILILLIIISVTAVLLDSIASPHGRVTGFYLPGEIIGMDGTASRSYANSTSALEHSSICEIPFSQLEKLSQELPSLQHHFFSIMGNEIAKDQQIHTLLSSYTAEERTASFLLGLSSRYARVSLSPTRFLLPMTRGDIG